MTPTVGGVTLTPIANSFKSVTIDPTISNIVAAVEGLSTGAIAGIAVGAVIVIIIIIILVVVLCKKKKGKGNKVAAGGNDLEMDARGASRGASREGSESER